jgi:hypothetical protein
MVELGNVAVGPHELHDPEKWGPVFPRDKREAFSPEIMLTQRDGITSDQAQSDPDLK